MDPPVRAKFSRISMWQALFLIFGLLLSTGVSLGKINDILYKFAATSIWAPVSTQSQRQITNLPESRKNQMTWQ